MYLVRLYQLCLKYFSRNSNINDHLLNRDHVIELPLVCLRDLLIILTPKQLEHLDRIYQQRHISTNDIWRRHFELIWSLSRDDRETYASPVDIPYKRLYFEYLFHDTQILQLGIYTYIQTINISKSIIDISYDEQIEFNLNRDSIVYCSKRRLINEQHHLVIDWNHQWNIYVQRYVGTCVSCERFIYDNILQLSSV
jgi:hypothetical protein